MDQLRWLNHNAPGARVGASSGMIAEEDHLMIAQDIVEHFNELWAATGAEPLDVLQVQVDRKVTGNGHCWQELPFCKPGMLFSEQLGGRDDVTASELLGMLEKFPAPMVSRQSPRPILV
jgi:hypothetical protein